MDEGVSNPSISVIDYYELMCSTIAQENEICQTVFGSSNVFFLFSIPWEDERKTKICILEENAANEKYTSLKLKHCSNHYSALSCGTSIVITTFMSLIVFSFLRYM